MDSNQTGIKTMGLGIACGVAAGALWGLVFLAPELARGHTPLQLSAGRYLAYGIAACALIAPSWRRLRAALGWRDWRALVWLSMLGNILYYLLLASAVQLGGVVTTSLVIGLLPVAVTVIGSREQGAVPLARLAPSLLLSAAGTACIAWQALAAPHLAARTTASAAAAAAAPAAGGEAAIGLLCAFGALLSWTAYAVANKRTLAALGHISSHDWSLLTGVATGALALLLAVPAFLLPHHGAAGAATGMGAAGWLRFIAIVTAVGLLCSIVGNALWNRASRILPLTMSGQLILFETLFALLYSFLWEARWPTGMECAAVALLCASVLSCTSAHRKT
ncbi:multidrug DMT transporter permease [Massilia sp. Root351]|uniref:DMT family transporter n=1 Tax=Massilia sp. Root351 TaxID=1736522 RepID=UPI00070F3305|nr:DMT family transporter [Massilia sp. Root351]KQV79900.1 multidrug DMT transporter permease [Massilia sp. Root351]